MSSELYEDIVGSSAQRLPATYDTCQHVACPRCGANPYDACSNPERRVQGQGSKSPCMVRLALGEGWAHKLSHVTSVGQ